MLCLGHQQVAVIPVVVVPIAGGHRPSGGGRHGGYPSGGGGGCSTCGYWYCFLNRLYNIRRPLVIRQRSKLIRLKQYI